MAEPTFYSTIAANQVRPYMPAAPVMVTATSYWSFGQRRSAACRASGDIPPVKLPAQVPEVAADAGGFVAAYRLGGSYPFDFEQYCRWLAAIPHLTWAALPDLPVERELGASFATMRERQLLTLRWARELWGEATEHYEYARAPWCWVPTVQGRDVADYLWMAAQLAELICDQRSAYDYTAYGLDSDGLDEGILSEARHGAAHFRVGIGSLCRRRSAAEVVAIVRAVADMLPGERFHLWGVKLGAIPALRAAGLLEQVASFDSAAWAGRIGRDLEQQKTSLMSQARHSWQIAWPAYVGKVAAQLQAPRPATVQLGLAF